MQSSKTFEKLVNFKSQLQQIEERFEEICINNKGNRVT